MQEQDTRQQATPAAITEDGTVSGGGLRYVMSGSWRNSNLSAVLPDLDKIEKSRPAGPVEIELSSVESIDTTGAWIIQRLRKDLEANGATVTLSGNDRIEQVIGQLPDKAEMEAEPVAREGLVERIFSPIGKAVVQNGADFLAGMYILGSAVRGAQMKLGRGRGVSPAAIVNQIDHMGVRAVPIIMLMSFLIGAIIAQQGAFQPVSYTHLTLPTTPYV